MSPIGILIIFIVILLLICFGFSKGKYNKKAGPKESVRLYIPHYMKEDEYKCPVCKARFWKDYMVCPNCGTKFTGTREDDGEFMEEMVIWEDDDD
ncbi:hypothetical protein [Aristaeella hokkaidonensis]|uniref:Uncharacterized protein n=2 Tax=Aristaeella hokkaidonensis TaxID=3046382 RepID=A0AC61N3T0_9FIRM|nr:hypothetical protein [Aristaeella hokkaidonensis]QUC66106.1 hypothetical protein JYE49_09515 [Aristaeella hokkaidonensis]SNT94891.1 hypothetical protein SAMN06297421_107120 [Aristaeella hokkaidonensis]